MEAVITNPKGDAGGILVILKAYRELLEVGELIYLREALKYNEIKSKSRTEIGTVFAKADEELLEVGIGGTA